MGCWKQTCVVSNLPIEENDEVAVFILNKRHYTSSHPSYCYSDALYTPIPMVFYGKYNDYGTCTKNYGPGLPFLVNYVKNNLIEFEEGSNECHDIEVKKDSFDIIKMWDADYEDRLYIKTPGNQTKLEMVMVHKHIFDMIVNDTYTSTIYPSNGDWYEKQYTINDLVQNEITNFVKLYREFLENSSTLSVSSMHLYEARLFGFNADENVAVVSAMIDSYKDQPFIKRILMDHSNSDAIELITEFVKAKFVMDFVDSIRKVWVPQSGRGSQSYNESSYRKLITAMTELLDKHDTRYDEYE